MSEPLALWKRCSCPCDKKRGERIACDHKIIIFYFLFRHCRHHTLGPISITNKRNPDGLYLRSYPRNERADMEKIIFYCKSLTVKPKIIHAGWPFSLSGLHAELWYQNILQNLVQYLLFTSVFVKIWFSCLCFVMIGKNLVTTGATPPPHNNFHGLRQWSSAGERRRSQITKCNKNIYLINLAIWASDNSVLGYKEVIGRAKNTNHLRSS